MKYLTTIIITLSLSTLVVAKEDRPKIDLEFKSISYQDESIPTLSIDLSSQELHRFDFIVAFASNFFELNRPFTNEEKREHVYLGLNYKF